MVNGETPLAVALDLIRQNGLIILALVALVWQVWFVSHDAAKEREEARAQLRELYVLSREVLEQRRQTGYEIATQLGKQSEAIRHLETLCVGKRK